MKRQPTPYRSILKGTAAFGGVQVFNLLINLIRGKCVALLLGPEGMGIASLFTTAGNTIQQFFSCGLNLSVVKEISEAKEQGQAGRFALAVAATRRLLRATAIAGAAFTLLAAPLLSQWTFGTDGYRWHFMAVAAVVLFTTAANGELSILQGLHEVKRLAYASVFGAVVGLAAGVPLYYFFGYGGIVPAMVALAVATFLFYRFHTRRALPRDAARPPREGMRPLMRRMLALGIVMLVANLLGTLATYLLNIFIGQHGTLSDVGLWQAANSITNQYVGLVFSALSLDFLPRLSAIQSNNSQVRKLVNRQSEVVALVAAPLAVLLILTAPLVIRVLLTREFLPLTTVIRIMGVGIFFKAVAFPMGYISFAKGDKRTFFWLEGVAGNALWLCLACLAYRLWGINGIGIAFVAVNAAFCLVYAILTRRLYQFAHSRQFLRTALPLGAALAAAFACSFVPHPWAAYGLMGLLMAAVSVYCLRGLRQRMRQS